MEKVTTFNSSRNFPQFLKLLFFVEMWERFSYYGMRALLVLFLTSHLGFEDKKAYAVYSLFAAIGYAGPVLGGFLADKLMGFRNMVLFGGITITLGHASLTMIPFDSNLIYIGLAFIAVGTGMFKGNITNLLGECYRGNEEGRSKGFSLFYVSVNLGGFFSSILCSYVAHLYGWHYGFGLAGVGMMLGLATFIKFQHILGDNGLSPRMDLMNKKILGLTPKIIMMISIVFFAFVVSKMLIESEFFAHLLSCTGVIILAVYCYIIMKSSPEQKRGLIALSILILFLMFFFALEMQLGSLINLFTQRNVVSEIFGFTVPASVSQALNPCSIIIFGFLFGRYRKFEAKNSTKVFAFGIATMAICFFTLYIGCLNAEDSLVDYIYLVIALSFMGLGELCVAPLVQEQATLLAPKRLRGLVMGIVMLALAFSNLAGIIISKFMSVPAVNGVVDPIVSLEIYQEGFLKIGMFSLLLTFIFLIFYMFIHQTISKNR
jgi:POT family proton-dependent oligopeptide transporter